jgi:hypothetical protein
MKKNTTSFLSVRALRVRSRLFLAPFFLISSLLLCWIGSVLAGRLAAAGFQVLLLEAGEPTQAKLGGRDFLLGNLTIFDIPLDWDQVRWMFYLCQKPFLPI